MNEIEMMEVALMRTQVQYKRRLETRLAFPSAVEVLEIQAKRGSVDKYGQAWYFDSHGMLVGVEPRWLI